MLFLHICKCFLLPSGPHFDTSCVSLWNVSTWIFMPDRMREMRNIAIDDPIICQSVGHTALLHKPS